jgi:aarF domain-containing kinase
MTIIVFGEQIFLHGFVHCDPHAGNVLVNVIPGTHKPRLILLDHGIY